MSLAVGPSETRETSTTGERRETSPLSRVDELRVSNRSRGWRTANGPLHLPVDDCRLLLERLGPSLAWWRAAEVAALRGQVYTPPAVDLGCGDGLVGALALRGQPIALGVDPARRQIARAMHVDAYERLLPQWIEALLPSTIRRESVSTIVSNSVLEHLPCPEETPRRALGRAGVGADGVGRRAPAGRYRLAPPLARHARHSGPPTGAD